MPEVVIPVVFTDPLGEEIIERLLQSPSFGAGEPEHIDGEWGIRVSVGSVETEEVASQVLMDSLDDVTPNWREHLRFSLPGKSPFENPQSQRHAR